MYFNINIIGELADEDKNYCGVKHSIESLQKDMVCLNKLITDKRGEQSRLEQSNTLLEKDFVSALKVITVLVFVYDVRAMYVYCVICVLIYY